MKIHIRQVTRAQSVHKAHEESEHVVFLVVLGVLRDQSLELLALLCHIQRRQALLAVVMSSEARTNCWHKFYTNITNRYL